MTTPEELVRALEIEDDEAEEMTALIAWAGLQKWMEIRFETAVQKGDFGYIEVEADRDLYDNMRYPIQIGGRGGEWLWGLLQVLAKYVEISPDVAQRVRVFCERAGKLNPGTIGPFWIETVKPP